MTKWEYTYLTTASPDLFDKLGNEGWELVCIERQIDRHLYYFKRPKEERVKIGLKEIPYIENPDFIYPHPGWGNEKE